MSEQFGQLIREAREKRGWSQEFLAAKVGATQSTIDRIESGSTRRSRVLPEICIALDLSIPGITKPEMEKPTTPNLIKNAYVLPKELVDRIENYKNLIGVSSDDEAVRRLIDTALNYQDDHNKIIERLIDKNRSVRSLREAAGFVIANHPLIKTVTFGDDKLEFKMTTGIMVTVYSYGDAVVRKPDGNYYLYYKQDAPRWVTPRNQTDSIVDADEIPF